MWDIYGDLSQQMVIIAKSVGKWSSTCILCGLIPIPTICKSLDTGNMQKCLINHMVRFFVMFSYSNLNSII